MTDLVSMTPEFIAEFSALRGRLAKALTELLKKDNDHKSYEGAWELTQWFNDVFRDPEGNAPPYFFVIQLHCYMIGPSRHYEWSGYSWDEALQKCRNDVETWIKEAYEINDVQEP